MFVSLRDDSPSDGGLLNAVAPTNLRRHAHQWALTAGDAGLDVAGADKRAKRPLTPIILCLLGVTVNPPAILSAIPEWTPRKKMHLSESGNRRPARTGLVTVMCCTSQEGANRNVVTMVSPSREAGVNW